MYRYAPKRRPCAVVVEASLASVSQQLTNCFRLFGSGWQKRRQHREQQRNLARPASEGFDVATAISMRLSRIDLARSFELAWGRSHVDEPAR